MNLTSITDRPNVHRALHRGLRRIALPVFSFFLNTDAEQTSQELRLDGDTSCSKWVAGVYYLELDINDNNGAITALFGPCSAYVGDPESAADKSLHARDGVLVGLRPGGIRSCRQLVDDRRRALHPGGQNDFVRDSSRYPDPSRATSTTPAPTGRAALGSYSGDRNDEEWSGRLQLNYTQRRPAGIREPQPRRAWRRLQRADLPAGARHLRRGYVLRAGIARRFEFGLKWNARRAPAPQCRHLLLRLQGLPGLLYRRHRHVHVQHRRTSAGAESS